MPRYGLLLWILKKIKAGLIVQDRIGSNDGGWELIGQKTTYSLPRL